jgi:hypothetical protein
MFHGSAKSVNRLAPRLDVLHCHSSVIYQQEVRQTSSLENAILYSCYVVAQLQGRWETHTPAGPVQITVKLPKVVVSKEHWALVNRVSDDGNEFDDHFIYEKPQCFLLCSVDGIVKAVMGKGSNMKHKVKWKNTNYGVHSVWRRKGKVTFKLVKIESIIHQQFGVSLTKVSPINDLENCENMSVQTINHNRLHIQTGRHPDMRSVMMNPSFNGCSTETDIPKLNTQIFATDASKITVNLSKDYKFEFIKEHCSSNLSLLKKVVNWARNSNRARNIIQMSEGRL